MSAAPPGNQNCFQSNYFKVNIVNNLPFVGQFFYDVEFCVLRNVASKLLPIKEIVNALIKYVNRKTYIG